MFDGNDYTDPIPIRKAAYAPGSPATAAAAAGILRNAFAYSRMRGRGGIAMAYPRNLRVPAALNYWAPAINNDGGALFMRDRRYVTAHWTHVLAHLCFTVVDDADSAAFGFLATDGSHTAVVSPSLALSAGSDALIPQGDTQFEGRGRSYEIFMAVPLQGAASIAGMSSQPALNLPGLIRFELTGICSVTSKEATPVTTTRTMVLDALSLWLECQESDT